MSAKNEMLDEIGYRVGKMVGSFQKGVSSKLSTPKRPPLLTAMTRGERWRGGSSPERVEAQQRSVQNTWIYISINKRSTAVRGAKFGVFNNPTGVEGEEKELPQHPLRELLLNPNPIMSGSGLWDYTQWWADLDGNAFWLIVVDSSGKPAEIYPLPASDVTVELSEDGSSIIDNYLYEPSNWGGRFDIDPKYIVHLKYQNPFNIARGMSPLVAALLPAEADTAMAHWNGQFFANDGVMPSAIISLSSGDASKPIDPEDLETIKKQLTTDYTTSARKTAITNAYDMKVDLIGYSQRDMDFLAGRQFTKEEIFSIYDIPAGMIDPNSTEANAKVGFTVFDDSIYNLLRMYDEQLNMQLARRFYGNGVKIIHEDVRSADVSLELQEANTHKSHLTIDEYREKYLNLEPLPDGRGDRLMSEAAPQDVISNTQPDQKTPNNAPSEPQTTEDDVEDGNTEEADVEVEQNEETKKALEDLKLFCKKSIGRLKSNGSPVAKFKSEWLDTDIINAINADLGETQDPGVVKSIFEYYEGWLVSNE